MQRFFIIKSSIDDQYKVINDEDSTVFSSNILKDCQNVQFNLHRVQKTNQTLYREAMESILAEFVRNRDPNLWRIEPDEFRGANIIDENSKIVIRHVSAEVALEVLTAAKAIKYPKES